MSVSEAVRSVELKYQAVVEKKNRIEGELSSKEQELNKLRVRRDEIMRDLAAMGITTEAELIQKIQDLAQEINGIIANVELKFKNAGV